MNRRQFLLAAGTLATSSNAGAQRKADHTLRIGAVSLEVAKGQVIRTTGYNGSVPGPLLRMKEGSPVTVDIFNETDVPELLHWHGLFVPVKADGAEEEGSPFVPPRGHLRVNFTPAPSGTRWYHTHVMAMDNLSLGAYSGQYGFLYVEPKNEPGAYDQEIFLAGRHWDPSVLRRGDPNNDWTVDYKIYSLGERALGHGEPVRVKQGQRVLFRLLNASATRSMNLALPGHKFKILTLDGNPVPTQATVDVLTLAVAERADVIVEMNNPGVWIMGAPRDEDRNKGMGVIVEYSGQTGAPQWRTPPDRPWDYSIFSGPVPPTRPSPDGKFDLEFHMLPAEDKPFNKWTVNGKLYPETDPLRVKKGKRYRILLHNGHEDGHPIHIHRHNFEIVKIAGKPVAGIVKDTVNVPRDGTVEVEFVADNPGLSLLHCHMQLHMDYGFKTMIKYV